MVAGAISEMDKLNKTSWEGLLDSLDRIPYLEMVGGRTNFTESNMTRVRTEMLDFASREVDYMTVFFTELWFDRLIQEHHMLGEMNINITNLAYYLANGEEISIKNALVGNDYKRKELMDLAILRFPDIMNPYLTVFMLKFDLVRKSLRAFVVEQIIVGIRCRFNYAKYVPNEEYLKQLREDTRETLVKDIDTLFEHTINDEEAVDKILHLNTPDQVVERLTEKTELGDKFDIRFELAATFGTLQFESLKMIDDNLKIMVAGAISEMDKLNKTSWEGLLDSLDRIPYLEMVGERTNFTESNMTRVRTEMLDFASREVDYMTVFFTELWFDRLIQEHHMLGEMNINITNLAYYLANGEEISIKNALVGGDIKRKDMMDLAILRFPDIMNPYLTVFMLKFDLVRKSLRAFVVEQIIVGIRCRFNYAKYVPNEEYLKQLREDTRETLVKDIDTLFEHTINDEEAVDKILHLNTPDQVVERLTEKTELGDKFDIRFELAATFGTLQFESLKMIDDNLKIMVAGAISEMDKLNKTSWEGLLDSLDRIPYLEMVGERTNFTESNMTRVRTEMLDFASREVDYMTVFFTELWFDRLIQEHPMLGEMNINITNLAYYLANGEEISIKNALVGNDYKRKELMDLAILRFPDIMNPYLTIMVAGAISEMDKLNKTSWEGLLDSLDRIPYLEMVGGRTNFTESNMTRVRTEMLDFASREVDYMTVFFTELWFDRLIQEHPMLGEMNINITNLAYYLANGEEISIKNALLGNDYKRRELMDLAILRFPDIMNPYLTVSMSLKSTGNLFKR
ncbi:Hypothetical predicted protein [Octopus vulgaris]|uniref:Uncharacterized protein n=1 Tax=Octopus vulgaris TaxID=6645 RepID=A0AA36BLC6_OCTVU|nr:Hypothetical predicted protein [Octopus vulgaris]